MALKFYENALANGMLPQPNDMYRNNEQAFIDQSWDNTSAKSPENGGAITEQAAIGSATYNSIEAWVKPTVSDVSKGATDSRDFLKLIFKSIDHETVRGLFYTFDDNYWIVHTYNHFNGLPQDVGIRRCNNRLKIIDPENGAVFSVPCVVDYDMMSPGNQINRYVITPNGHIIVITQANNDTLRLLTLNKRFILDGRVFRINAFQNSLEYSTTDATPTILYLDMYLDEEHTGDDMVNGIADNGKYDYDIVINSNDMDLATGATGTLTSTVTLNGEQVSKSVVWSSTNTEVVKVNNQGGYEVVGEVGETATIKATLSGNSAVVDSITITVASLVDIDPVIVIAPSFDKIRQYQQIGFKVKAEYNGQTITPTTVSVTKDSNAVVLTQVNDTYYITCQEISQVPIHLNVTVTNSSPSFTATKQFTIKTVSMLG